MAYKDGLRTEVNKIFLISVDLQHMYSNEAETAN